MGKRLFVGNLSYATTDRELRSAFEGMGLAVRDVVVIVDRETGQSKGFGFVEMETDGDAQRAIQECNGYVVSGRPLRVNEAHERERTAGPPRGNGGGGGYRPEPRSFGGPPPDKGGRDRGRKGSRRRRDDDFDRW